MRVLLPFFAITHAGKVFGSHRTCSDSENPAKACRRKHTGLALPPALCLLPWAMVWPHGWWFGDENHTIPASLVAGPAGQEAGAGADVAQLA